MKTVTDQMNEMDMKIFSLNQRLTTALARITLLESVAAAAQELVRSVVPGVDPGTERVSEPLLMVLESALDDAGYGYNETLCDECQKFPRVDGEELCRDCLDNHAEAAWERQQGECFRGGEAAGYLAEQQAERQRLK